MKRRFWALALGSLVVWSLYLVPLAAMLDVGYGHDGFRRYGSPYAAVRVLEATPSGLIRVRAALPPGAVVTLYTNQGRSVGSSNVSASEVEALLEWAYEVPDGAAAAHLVIHLDNEEFQWELGPSPRFVSFPWWFRVAPPWAKRWHMERVGLIAGSDQVPPDFVPIGQGQHSGIQDRQAVLITDQGAWEAHWKSHAAGTIPTPGAPEFDFTVESIIAVHAGPYPSGGHSAEVTRVYWSGSTLHLAVRIRDSASGTGAVMTYPYQFIRIPKASPSIKLIVEWF